MSTPWPTRRPPKCNTKASTEWHFELFGGIWGEPQNVENACVLYVYTVLAAFGRNFGRGFGRCLVTFWAAFGRTLWAAFGWALGEFWAAFGQRHLGGI